MKREAMKWAAIGGVIVFLLLYGIEVTTTGIDHVYGPVEGQATAPVTELLPQQVQLPPEQPTSAASNEMRGEVYPPQDTRSVQEWAERLPGVYGQTREPSVNRVAEHTAGLLQSLSSNGIRTIVSIFDSLTE